MSNIKIISDSSCDLGDKLALENNIDLVPFYVSFDRENYFKEGVDIKNNEFYKALREQDTVAKTSLPSIQDYINVFSKYASEGIDIICFCLSSKLSGSFQSATNAKNELLEMFPDRKIEIIDTKSASVSQGLIVLEAAKMLKNNLDLDKIVENSYKIIEESRIIFTVDSLDTLQKGGRIGKVASIAGTVLNIKPIILLENGEILPISKTLGRSKAISQILKMLDEYIKYDIKDYSFAIINSDAPDEALKLQGDLVKKTGISAEYPPFDIGVTIGSHVGRTAIGIAFAPKFNSLTCV